MEKFGEVALGVFAGVITLAIISVIIAPSSQTPQVIQAFASALANVVGAAVKPQPAPKGT